MKNAKGDPLLYSENDLKNKIQSQLQALKEEVENIPCSGYTFHAVNFKKEALKILNE